jgi:hypothetical protein
VCRGEIRNDETLAHIWKIKGTAMCHPASSIMVHHRKGFVTKMVQQGDLIGLSQSS